MKKILIAGVLAVVAASPALAASYHHRGVAARSYAYVPSADAYGPAVRSYVVSNGQVLGADPDPFIRESLIRQGSPAELSN